MTPSPSLAQSNNGYFDGWRWSCPKCGRFISADNVKQWETRDDSAYHGVADHVSATCARDGEVEPCWAPTRWVGANA